MPASLRDYTDSPLTVPSPFPAQSARKSTRDGLGAWPSDVLPAEAIAVDLARSGVTFQRGIGYDTLAERYAIRATADELRASIAARTRVLARIRPHLPAPSIDSGDTKAANAFLKTFDGAALVRRSELAVTYSEAGSPGGITSADLRELATVRWGAPRKLRGDYIFRPISATVTAATVTAASALSAPPIGTPAPPSNFDQALAYASGRLALFGDLPAAETLGEIFALDPDEVAEVLQSATRATTTLSLVR